MHLEHIMEKRASDNGFLGLSGKVILLALVFLVLGDHVNGTRNAATSAERDLEIERKLKLMNKPAVKSIQVCFFSHSFSFLTLSRVPTSRFEMHHTAQ